MVKNTAAAAAFSEILLQSFVGPPANPDYREEYSLAWWHARQYDLVDSVITVMCLLVWRS